jgi:peptidoglycan/LPS O-acetylase OafA/YrhL
MTAERERARRPNPLLQLRSSFLVTVGAFLLVSVVLREALPQQVAIVVAVLLIGGAFYVQMRDPRATQLWHWRTRITFATLLAGYLALATFVPDDLPTGVYVGLLAATLGVLGLVSYLAIRTRERTGSESTLSRAIALTGAGLVLVGLLSLAQGG